VDAVAVGLVAAFATLAGANWCSVERVRSQRSQVAITKSGATVTLVVFAGWAGEMAGDARGALVVAVVLCLAGDILLLGRSDGRFLAGLSAFALGHAAYVVCALLVGVEGSRMTVAIGFLAVLLVFQTATKMLPGAKRHGGTAMLTGVAAYTVIISAMVLTATGTPSWVAMVGAKLFAVSDTMIGYNRFVRSFRGADVAIMVTYHAGQLLLIAGLIAGG
jgi:uncharacterized membrane protein YhhN